MLDIEFQNLQLHIRGTNRLKLATKAIQPINKVPMAKNI